MQKRNDVISSIMTLVACVPFCCSYYEILSMKLTLTGSFLADFGSEYSLVLCVMMMLFSSTVVWLCQEPVSEASHSAVVDVPSSAATEPSTAPPPTCTFTVDQTTADEQVAASVPDVAMMASTADTLAQLPAEDKDVTESTDTVTPAEPVFASAAGAAKPRPDVKNDLSSMFKSLSAKMKQQQRQSRFSDFSPADSAGLPSDPVTAAAACLPSTIGDSNRLLLTSVDTGPSGPGVSSISLQSSSHHLLSLF